MRTKEEFHSLIDEIKDEETLRSYLNLIRLLNTNQTGKLWNDLNAEEKAELMLSYDESFLQENLVPHEEVKKQHGKWLEK